MISANIFPNIVCSILELCDNLDYKIISNYKCDRDKDSNFYYRDNSNFTYDSIQSS